MEHIRGNGNVGGDEHQHGRHVGMDHAAAFGDAADTAGFVPQSELYGDLLLHGVGGHDALGGGLAAGFRQPLHQGGKPCGDGVDGQGQTDDAGGSDHDIVGGDPQLRRRQSAHLLGNFDAVCVAGIGVAAVADDGLGGTVA